MPVRVVQLNNSQIDKNDTNVDFLSQTERQEENFPTQCRKQGRRVFLIKMSLNKFSKIMSVNLFYDVLTIHVLCINILRQEDLLGRLVSRYGVFTKRPPRTLVLKSYK